MTLSILKTEPKTDAAPAMLMEHDTRKDLREMVLRVLSSTYVLMIKTQAVHWNISGPLFKSVHDLTEEQYTDLFEAIDDLAERIRALGLKAPISYEAMQDFTSLNSFSDPTLSAEQMLRQLTNDNEELATELIAATKAAAEVGDPATEDLFTERLRVHQKNAWMLRTMIES